MISPERSCSLEHLGDVDTAERASRAEAHGASGLAALYQRHVGRPVALARLLTGDPELAEDLAHDAFVRVAGRFGHLRQPDRFDAYLRRTVVNLSKAHFRRLRIERDWLRRQRPQGEVALGA